MKDPTDSSSAAKPLTSFSVPAVSWTCDTCLVPNKEDGDQCVCCGAKKPGSGPSKVWVGGAGCVWACVCVVRWGLVCGEDCWDRCDCVGVSGVEGMRSCVWWGQSSLVPA